MGADNQDGPEAGEEPEAGDEEAGGDHVEDPEQGEGEEEEEEGAEPDEIDGALVEEEEIEEDLGEVGGKSAADGDDILASALSLYDQHKPEDRCVLRAVLSAVAQGWF